MPHEDDRQQRRGERRNVERQRADIDSGRTGDKVPFPDPAAAPLGTDDEAAGTPPDAARLALAAQEHTGADAHEATAVGGSRRRSRDRRQPGGRPLIAIGLVVLAFALLLFLLL
jgi:hypothetical protein